jgi:DNA-binding response OmpR family regulator
MDLLKELAYARRRLTLDDLRERVWDSPGPEDATIRSTISRLRGKLRQAFGLSRSDNPIRCFDGGYQLELPKRS